MKLPRLPRPTPKKKLRGELNQDLIAKSLALRRSLAEASTKPVGWKFCSGEVDFASGVLCGEGLFAAGAGWLFTVVFCGILIRPRDNWSIILTSVLCAMNGELL